MSEMTERWDSCKVEQCAEQAQEKAVAVNKAGRNERYEGSSSHLDIRPGDSELLVFSFTLVSISSVCLLSSLLGNGYSVPSYVGSM